MNYCWEFERIYINNFYYLSRYPVMDLDLDFENSIMFIELTDVAKILLEVKCPHVWLLIRDFYHEISMIKWDKEKIANNVNFMSYSNKKSVLPKYMDLDCLVYVVLKIQYGKNYRPKHVNPCIRLWIWILIYRRLMI